MENQQLRRIEQSIAICDTAVEDLAFDMAPLEQLPVLEVGEVEVVTDGHMHGLEEVPGRR